MFMLPTGTALKKLQTESNYGYLQENAFIVPEFQRLIPILTFKPTILCSPTQLSKIISS